MGQIAAAFNPIDELVRSNRIKTPADVLEQRAVKRLSIAEMNEMDADEIGGILEKQRFDSRPGYVKALDLIDLPRNVIANVLLQGVPTSGERGTFGLRKITTSDALRSMGVKNNIVNAVGGFVGDTLFDPLTYVGPLGWGTKVGKTALTRAGTKSLRSAIKTGGAGASAADRLVRAAGGAKGAAKALYGSEQSTRLERGLSYLGGDRRYSGTFIDEHLGRVITPDTPPELAEKITATQEFMKGAGRGTGRAIRLGVPKDSAGSEILHLPWPMPQVSVQVPAFTSEAVRARNAQRMARFRSLGSGTLNAFPAIGAAESIANSINDLYNEVDARIARHKADIQAIDDNLDLSDEMKEAERNAVTFGRVPDLHNPRYVPGYAEDLKAIRDKIRERTNALHESINAIREKPKDVPIEAFFYLSELANDAKRARTEAAAAHEWDDVVRTYRQTRFESNRRVASQSEILDQLLELQESSKKGGNAVIDGRTVDPRKSPDSEAVEELAGLDDELDEFGSIIEPNEAEAVRRPIRYRTKQAVRRAIDTRYRDLLEKGMADDDPAIVSLMDQLNRLEDRPVTFEKNLNIMGDGRDVAGLRIFATGSDGEPMIPVDSALTNRVFEQLRGPITRLDEALETAKSIRREKVYGDLTPDELDELQAIQDEVFAIRREIEEISAPLRPAPPPPAAPASVIPSSPPLPSSPINSASLFDRFVEITKSDEQAEALMALVEARAASAGMTADDWIAARIADIRTGEAGSAGPDALEQATKATIEFQNDGRAIITAFALADVSSIAHELAHIFRRELNASDLATATKWVGGTWDRNAEEMFARGFERYLRDGKAPTPQLESVFQRFMVWLVEIYRRLKGSPINVKIPKNVREVFDRLLTDPRAVPPKVIEAAPPPGGLPSGSSQNADGLQVDEVAGPVRGADVPDAGSGPTAPEVVSGEANAADDVATMTDDALRAELEAGNVELTGNETRDELVSGVEQLREMERTGIVPGQVPGDEAQAEGVRDAEEVGNETTQSVVAEPVQQPRRTDDNGRGLQSEPPEGSRVVNGHLFDRSGVPVYFTHTGDEVPIAFDRQSDAESYLRKSGKETRKMGEVVRGPSGRWWIVSRSRRAPSPPATATGKATAPPATTRKGKKTKAPPASGSGSVQGTPASPSGKAAPAPSPSVSPSPAKEPWEMTARQFDLAYSQHVDYRSKSTEEADVTRKAIEQTGFRAGFNVNVMPIVRHGTVGVPGRYRPKPGQTVYLVPKSGRKDGPNGMMTVAGWKPRDSEVVRLVRDDESLHEAAVRQALAAGKPVPPHVLAEYPELAKGTSPTAKAAPEKETFTEGDFEIRKDAYGSHPWHVYRKGTDEVVGVFKKPSPELLKSLAAQGLPPPDPGARNFRTKREALDGLRESLRQHNTPTPPAAGLAKGSAAVPSPTTLHQAMPDYFSPDEYRQSIRDEHVRSLDARRQQLYDLADADPRGAEALANAFHAKQAAALDHVAALQGEIRNAMDEDQEELTSMLMDALGIDDMRVGTALSAPMSAVAKLLDTYSEKQNARKWMMRLARAKRHTFGTKSSEIDRLLGLMSHKLTRADRIELERRMAQFTGGVRKLMGKYEIPMEESDAVDALVRVVAEQRGSARAGNAAVRNTAWTIDPKSYKGKLQPSPLVDRLAELKAKGTLKNVPKEFFSDIEKYADQWLDEFQTLGNDELRDELIGMVIPGYVPHVPTEETRKAMRNAASQRGMRSGRGITESFQRARTLSKYMFEDPTEPGAWRRFMGYEKELVESALKRYSETGDASILSEFDPELVRSVQLYNGMRNAPPPSSASIDEINDMYRAGKFRILTQASPEVDDFFSTNMARITGERFAAHQRSIARKSLNQLIAANMVPINADDVAKAGERTIQIPGGGAIRIVDRVRDPLGASTTIVEMGGKTYRQLSPETRKAAHNVLVGLLDKDHVDGFLPEVVADHIDQISAAMNPKAINPLLNMLDTATGVFKQFALLHPSWFIFNLVGDAALAVSGGFKPQLMAKALPTMLKVRMARNNPEALAKLLVTVQGRTLDGNELVRLLTDNRIWAEHQPAETMSQVLRPTSLGNQPSMRSEQRLAGLRPSGVRKDFAYLADALAPESLGRAGKAAGAVAAVPTMAYDRLGRYMIQPNVRANALSSDVMRASAFMSALEDGFDTVAASDKVLRHMLTFSDFTQTENTVFRRLIPFYSWMRANLAYQTQLLFERPVYAAMTPRLRDAIEEAVAGEDRVPQDRRPSWMQEQMALQIGSDPTDRFALMLNSSLPSADVFNVLQGVFGMDGAMRMLHWFTGQTNPILSSGLQLGSGTEWFSGRQIGPDKYSGDVSAGEFLTRQIRPISEYGFGLVDGRVPSAYGRSLGEGIARQFVGGRIQSFDEGRLLSSIEREFKKREDGIRAAVWRLERQGDKSGSIRARAKLMALYRDAAHQGIDIPNWAEEQLGLVTAQ